MERPRWEDAAVYTLEKRLGPMTGRFFSYLNMKTFSTYHFSAGSVDDDPIMRKYNIIAVNAAVRKKYEEDFQEAVGLSSDTSIAVFECCFDAKGKNLRGLNCFARCRLESLYLDRFSYGGRPVRGIDELLDNMGKAEFEQFTRNALKLTEQDIMYNPDVLN